MIARGAHSVREARWLRLLLGVTLLGTGAWAASGPITVPTDLPNRTVQGELRLRWAVVRDSATVRAVGLAESPNRDVSWTRLGFYGLDGSGRIVSRGESDVQGGLGRTGGPFEVVLSATGAEERFELVVLRAREGKPGD
jgi:hypothetical protein